jgi:divalent metal cation (Fe/Co/Zn/Cd) transporter
MNKSIKYKNSKALSMLLFAIILVLFNILISILMSYFTNSVILRTYGLVSSVELIIIILLYKSAKKSINTPDLIYNFGFGKYENLAVIISSIIIPIILINTIFNTIYYAESGISTISNIRLLIIASIIIIIISKIKELALNNFYKNSNISIFKSIVIRTNKLINPELFLLLTIGIQFFILSNFQNINLYFDVICAVILILSLLYLPLKNLRNSLNQLLDKTLPDEILFDFLSVIIEHFNLMCEYKSMRTRRSGEDIFVDIDIIMPSDISLDKVYQIENSIKKSLNMKYPNAHPRVYAQPCIRNCIYKSNGDCPVIKSDNQLKDNDNA